MPKFLPSSSADDNQQRAPPDAKLGREFKRIFEKETGRFITDEEAQEYAEALVNVVNIFFSNFP